MTLYMIYNHKDQCLADGYDLGAIADYMGDAFEEEVHINEIIMRDSSDNETALNHFETGMFEEKVNTIISETQKGAAEQAQHEEQERVIKW